jgi:pilus assembly protein Flp/PilA
MELMLKMVAMVQLGFADLVDKTRDRERGATAVEYGLLVALIAAVIVGVVATLGTQITAAFQTVVDALP